MYLIYRGKLCKEPPSQKLGLGRLRWDEHTVFFSKRRKNSSLCAQPTPSRLTLLTLLPSIYILTVTLPLYVG